MVFKRRGMRENKDKLIDCMNRKRDGDVKEKQRKEQVECLEPTAM